MNELDVPDELKELMLDFQVSLECRDKAITSIFQAKRAIYYGKQAEKARREFWQKVRELYPQTKEEGWSYNLTDQILFKNDSPNRGE